MISILIQLFPLIALFAAAFAYFLPQPFLLLQPAIVPLLGVVMFGMGITLKPEHFRDALMRPHALVIGMLAQFLLMPFTGWLLAEILGLSAVFAAGLILVGSCPGGTASNVITYLARGNVALSVTLTALSTLMAIVATPLLTWLFAGKLVPVPAVEMLLTILKIILVPVGLGVLVNMLLEPWMARVKEVFPAISVTAIVLIIAIVVAANHGELKSAALALAIAVMLHNTIGLFGGYWLARAFRLNKKLSRTIAIEVGMQNSGLGAALATAYFPVGTALPAAIFSIWHNISGAALAAFWSGGETGRRRRED